MAKLDDWERQLSLCYEDKTEHPVFEALRHTVREFGIPPEPFLKLIEANRMDQAIRRHPTFEDLLYYCRFSANPCGRLFLYVFGYGDEERQRLSDHTCTALQLTNFWQDIAIDHGKGRVYIPEEDLDRFGYPERSIAHGIVDEAFVRLMKFEIERTRELFRKGLELVKRVHGRLRIDIRLFSQGGLAMLGAIERSGYDVYRNRPTLSRGAKTRLVLNALLGVG